MQKDTLEILTSYSIPKKVCVLGNVAVARGAIEAGVNGVFSYPGTPSTEISEVFNDISRFQSSEIYGDDSSQTIKSDIYFEYSINEKIALEKAIAFAIGNRNSLCVMKNVGMNVASDALMSIPYQTISGGLVIVVCDDPGCHSSSNEQDSRHWALMANVPLFNPANGQEAKNHIKSAFELSRALKLPVLVRLTTRVSHTRSVIEYQSIETANKIPAFLRVPENINIPAKTAQAHKLLLEKLSPSFFEDLYIKWNQIASSSQPRWGVISTGVASVYVKEILGRSSLNKNYIHLNIGLFYPFPEKQLVDFCKNNLDGVLVLEELDALLENQVRILVQKEKLAIPIYGKGYADLPLTGEFNLDIIQKTLYTFSNDITISGNKLPIDQRAFASLELVNRPPALCAGCPHRATFYALKLIVPRDVPEVILCGDIGCNGLGALPPLTMIDTINHMGMSVSMAQGLSAALYGQSSSKKTIAMLGDGTFFHSGLTSLVNAIYTQSQILVIIFDNRTIGMTGHQDHPGASRKSKYKEIPLLPLIKGLGVDFVENINPFDLQSTLTTLQNAMEVRGVSVVVAQAPCIFLPEYIEGKLVRKKVVVDHTLCNTCGNHSDMTMHCSRSERSLNNLSRAKQKVLNNIKISGDQQLCPANICNHGFFNAILEGNYKEAIQLVRDKMLFSKTCGDICHRPCEMLSETNHPIPIKKLKKFVSSIDENFFDIHPAVDRINQAQPKNKKVAIVGAGPAGMSAAYDLIREGYQVDLYDKNEQPGGMLKYIIPHFRMNKTGFDFEAGILMDLGVTFYGNIELGINVHISQLCMDYDAVILALGLWKSKSLDLIQTHVPVERQFSALSFLQQFNALDRLPSQAFTWVIIGGGNSAIDAARAAKSLNPESEVHLICIESRDKMPAFEEEIEEALHEGVLLHPESYISSCSVQPQNISFVIQHNSNEMSETLHSDFVITAIGQTAGDVLFHELNLTVNEDINPNLFAESHPSLFLAGDMVKGNHQSVIGAIGSGRKAAVAVRTFLENYTFSYEGELALQKLIQSNSSYFKSALDNHSFPELLDEIQSMDLYQSCAKCNHCIDNFGCPAMVKVNGKIEIDYHRCTNCGLCIDVCPNHAIRFEEEKMSLR